MGRHAYGGNIFKWGGVTDPLPENTLTYPYKWDTLGGKGKIGFDYNPVTYKEKVVNPLLRHKNNNNKFNLSYLRYAPVLGAAISSIGDLTGLTNKPNYGNADFMLSSTHAPIPKVGYKPIGNSLTFSPFDVNYAGNRLSA